MLVSSLRGGTGAGAAWGGVCNRCYQTQFPVAVGLLLPGQVASIPLTVAFGTCGCKYCSSRDPNVLCNCASFRGPREPSLIVTDELAGFSLYARDP